MLSVTIYHTPVMRYWSRHTDDLPRDQSPHARCKAEKPGNPSLLGQVTMPRGGYGRHVDYTVIGLLRNPAIPPAIEIAGFLAKNL